MSINMDKTQQLDAVAPAATAYSVPRVNLMPPEILAQDSFRRTQFMLGGGALAVVAALAGGVVWANLQVSKANDALAAEKATTAQLATEEAKYAEVPKTLGQISAITNAQSQAMATDVAWYQQLDAINAQYPQGLVFDTLSMQMNQNGEAAPTTNPLADPTTIGNISILSKGPSYLNTADWLDSLNGHKGFADAVYSSASRAHDEAANATRVTTTTTVNFTPDILTHRFDKKAS